jgi:transposase
MGRRKQAHHTIGADRRVWLGDEGDSDSLAQSQAEMVSGGADPSTSVEHRRRQVIALLADKRPVSEIIAMTGYCPRTIRQIAQRYREAGPAGLADGRRHSAGAAPLLSDTQQHELRQELQSPPTDGGAWTGPKVAEWIAAKTGRRVHRQRGWEYLRRFGAGATAAPTAHDDQTIDR